MPNRLNPVRRYSRFPVRWPVLYRNGELLAEGTVLDLTSLGWRLAGSMPVIPGMQLMLQVCIPERSTPLRIQRATVLWVNKHEFAIEAHDMDPIDHAWVTEFLRQKLGLTWMSRSADQETSVHTRDEAPCGETALSEPSVPSVEDIQQQLFSSHTTTTDTPANTRCHDGDSDFQHREDPTPHDHLPVKIVHEASRIVRGMLAIKAARVGTGRDLIADN